MAKTARPMPAHQRLPTGQGAGSGADAHIRWTDGELIKHIDQRYHQRHPEAARRLLERAEAAGAAGIGHRFGDDLRQLLEDLDRHLFKEDMRLFPMMEQGGSPLITQLLDDLQRDHARHLQQLQSLQAFVQQPHPGLPEVAREAWLALRQELTCFAANLARHVQLEDDMLFPRFRIPRDPTSPP